MRFSLLIYHYVKSNRIRSFSGSNAAKNGPEKLQIQRQLLRSVYLLGLPGRRLVLFQNYHPFLP